MSDSDKAAGRGRGKLAARALRRFGAGYVVFGAILFLPAGSLSYWNGWLFMGSIAVLMIMGLGYLLAKDPALLERRLKTREREKRQRGVVSLSLLFVIPLYVLPGLDWRFGWSHMPLWLVALGVLHIIAGYALFLLVMRSNSYASRVIEIAEGQKVIDTGPYASIRHPLYLSTLVIYFASALVLGSYWALIPAIGSLLFLAPRILNEEDTLRRDLPGYEDYMKRVRWRIIPGIW